MMNIGKRTAARARDRIDVRIRPICDPRTVFYSCLTNDGAGWDERFDCIVTRVSNGLPSEQCPLVVVLPTHGGPMAAYEAPRGSSDEEAIDAAVHQYIGDHP
jgi:hypothetical protein